MNVAHSARTVAPIDLPRGFRDRAPAHEFIREELITRRSASAGNMVYCRYRRRPVEFLSVLEEKRQRGTRQQNFVVDGPEQEPAGLRYELSVASPAPAAFASSYSSTSISCVVSSITPARSRGCGASRTRLGFDWGGGRYDSLMRKLGGPDLPALAGPSVSTAVALLNHEEDWCAHGDCQCPRVRLRPLLTSECLRVTDELRHAGIATELYVGAEYAPGRQLKYADRLGVRVAVLYGSHEHAEGDVTLKKLGA